MIEIAKTLAQTYIITVLLYALYLSYCTLRVMRDTGRFKALPAVVRANCYLILGVTIALDVLFNIVVGTVIFLEIPERNRLTFTARCKKWKRVPGRRGDFARWVCESWLNPAEPGHC